MMNLICPCGIAWHLSTSVTLPIPSFQHSALLSLITRVEAHCSLDAGTLQFTAFRPARLGYLRIRYCRVRFCLLAEVAYGPSENSRSFSSDRKKHGLQGGGDWVRVPQWHALAVSTLVSTPGFILRQARSRYEKPIAKAECAV